MGGYGTQSHAEGAAGRYGGFWCDYAGRSVKAAGGLPANRIEQDGETRHV